MATNNNRSRTRKSYGEHRHDRSNLPNDIDQTITQYNKCVSEKKPVPLTLRKKLWKLYRANSGNVKKLGTLLLGVTLAAGYYHKSTSKPTSKPTSKRRNSHNKMTPDLPMSNQSRHIQHNQHNPGSIVGRQSSAMNVNNSEEEEKNDDDSPEDHNTTIQNILKGYEK